MSPVSLSDDSLSVNLVVSHSGLIDIDTCTAADSDSDKCVSFCCLGQVTFEVQT